MFELHTSPITASSFCHPTKSGAHILPLESSYSLAFSEEHKMCASLPRLEGSNSRASLEYLCNCPSFFPIHCSSALLDYHAEGVEEQRAHCSHCPLTSYPPPYHAFPTYILTHAICYSWNNLLLSSTFAPLF